MMEFPMEEQIILSKLRLLPKELKREILDFIEFLLTKHQQNSNSKKRPQFGSAKGVFKMSEDFDEPLDDFNEYMK